MGNEHRRVGREVMSNAEWNEVGAKAAYRVKGQDPWADVPDDIKLIWVNESKATIAAVEPLIRADQTERVLEAVRACFGLPKDGVEVIQIRRVLNESQPPVAEHGMDWQRVQRSAKQAEAYPDWAKGSEVNAPPVAAEPYADTPKPCHVCGAPIEYESYATVSKCRHLVRMQPPLPTDGTQAEQTRYREVGYGSADLLCCTTCGAAVADHRIHDDYHHSLHAFIHAALEGSKGC